MAVEVPMMIGAGFTDAVAVAASGMAACVEVPAKLAIATFSLDDWSWPMSWMSELRIPICTPPEVATVWTAMDDISFGWTSVLVAGS